MTMTRRSMSFGIATALGLALLIAAPARADEAVLTFASWNVCKVDCGDQAPAWDVRRERVARVINESGADVGIQEAKNTATSFAPTQVADIRNLIAPAGYQLPVFPNSANQCARPRNAAGRLVGPSPCGNTSALFYRSSTVDQVTLANGLPSAGIAQLGSIAEGQDANSARRSVMWSYLQGRNGTGPFLAISLHAASDKSGTGEASRVVLGQSLGNWVAQMNTIHGMTGTPAVLMADLNSFDSRQPQGIQKQLTNTGWVDSFTAPTKTNIRYSTVNQSMKYRLTGFPTVPRMQKTTKKNPLGAAPRIDYIMSLGAKVRPLSYEVVVYLNGRSFDPAYQGSDHQMIRATLAFG
jgi:endonuclease/exonuclease/phosphatase family metal-dependent hydrolase